MNVLANKVKQKLKLSYETLDPNIQQIILDIVCFFIGIDKKISILTQNRCNFYLIRAIDVLIEDSNEIQIYDQLGEFGREIVGEEDYDELM